MFQRFHENTQVSRFVKHLLSSEAIPLLQTIVDGMPLIEGCKYLLDDYPVVCKTSGFYGDTAVVEPLSLSNITYTNFNSKVGWYDDLTHKQLGDYLRYLRDKRSIDLMKYYNCYNSTELTDVYLNTADIGPLVCSDDHTLDSDGTRINKVEVRDGSDEPVIYCGVLRKYDSTTTYRFGSLPGYKVVAVPVKFDTTYTVAVEAHNVVSVRGIIYNSNNGMIEEYDPDVATKKSEKVYYSDYLSHTCATLPFAKFKEPFTYRIELASDTVNLPLAVKQALYMRQKDLYLVLQVPSDSSSSIVVLEGDYTNNGKFEVTQGSVVFDIDPTTGKVIDSRKLHPLYDTDTIPEDKCSVKYVDNLSLLYYNTGVSYAFSDRLIEYLLLNVVTPLETLSTNVSRVQLSLRRLYPSYNSKLLKKEARYGVWDDSIPKYVRSYISENRNKLTGPFDHDGHINKDVEELLSANGVYTT